MLRKLLFFTAILLATNALVFAQSGSLKGKITDSGTKEAIPFASIVIESGGKQYGGVNTDIDGNYNIKPIPPGKYDVKAIYVGYKPLMIKDVIINADKITFLDVAMESTVQTLTTFEVKEYAVPLISKDQTSTGGTMTSEEMSKMPGRSAQSVAVTVGGVFSQDNGSTDMNIRGQRSEGTIMYIDGVRVRGSSSLPQASIEEVAVITGGTPAQYGDATGGIVNITTKGPSREFGAGAEFLTSQFLDSYGYNLLGFNVQGPLIMGRDTNSESSLLGFFLSGELSSVKDDLPSAIGTWKVKDDVLAQLAQNPLRPSGTGFGSYRNSEFITKDQLENLKAKDNALNQGVNLSGKIDVRTTEYTNLTFGGSIDYSKYKAWQYAYSLFNNKNNPLVTENTWRLYGRFTQRFPTDKDSKSTIKNVYYSIQADYSKYAYVVEDAEHKDNLFDYGYVGKFTTHKIKSYELGSDTILGYNNIWVHNGFRDTLYDFQRSEINSDLSNYTDEYYNLYPLNSGFYTNSVTVQNGGALLNGQQPDAVYGLWSNTGTKYSAYKVNNETQIGINASGSADIKNHAISFGLQYEQRIDRYYSYNPVPLWTLMRQLTNKHIEQLDKLNPHAVYDENGIFQDTVWYDRLLDLSSQSFFDYNLRNKLGLNPSGLDWIDVDNIDPSTFSIDMFSPDELLANGQSLVSYYGYDYTGKKLDHKPTFEDFFTAKDSYGNYKREIGAFEPIYMAGYIQDKFAFNDLIFNVGVRVDRYDANQKVLKDAYSLYETKTVSEVTELGDNAITHPSNMGSDYVVYVNDINNPTAVVGYRNGSTWYNAQGTEIADPTVLETPSGIAPCLVDPSSREIKASAFKDYEPQTNIMPRISFSFPISDVALFFAHYDVLTKRPTTGTRFDPTDYLFLENVNNTIANPNLKPEKTIDYELGFQQKLSNSSSLKFSAYYREMRNMVQAFRFTEAYPKSYTSYNNIDFGTVKGATLTYDLRRTSNIWVKASYTIQFADGTGSNATSAASLISAGQPNLRVTMPLEYDRRHSLSCVVDYRYSEGKFYNGPVWTKKIKGTEKVKSIPILQNTGVNFTFTGGSGVPYSRSSKIVPTAFGSTTTVLQGSINGSRLPWQFKIDARLDKDITIKYGKKDAKKRKEAYLNVYLQVLNVLNTQNVMIVYPATGNANDDGYLAAAEYQAAISSQIYPQAYREMYATYVDSPYNYSLPRRIRLGVSFDF
jgi:outer membrane receptor protein involved in Fe transport